MVSIRHAGVGDIDSILDLWAVAEAEPTVTDDAEALHTLLSFEPESVLLAVEGNRVVGSLIIGWDGWRGSFYRLAVAPDHRRMGVGRHLVSQGETQLAATGARRMSVFAVASDQRAVPFWISAGYAPQQDRRRLVKNLPQRPR